VAGETVKKSLLEYYRAAPPAAHVHGRAWYRLAQLWCERAARQYRVPRRTVCAVVAVLSQRVEWRQNLLWADQALRGDVPPHLRTVRDKVQRLMDGEEPTRVVSGPKIVEFYRALAGDLDAVVLDSWMLRALEHHAQAATPNQNVKLAGVIERDARTVGLPPAVYQAIVWCAIRGKAF
jgi:hypothetical protein